MGVHVAAFGTVNGSIDKLWSAITDCSELAKFMPNIESYVEVQPDHELPPNERWYRLQLSFCGCLVFQEDYQRNQSHNHETAILLMLAISER